MLHKMESSKKDNKATLDRIFRDCLGVRTPEIKPEARIQEDFGADSLDCVELVMFIEDEFGFEISDAEAESISTVKDVYEFIEKKQKVTS